MAENRSDFFVVASLPAVQRDLFLSRCLRREKDAPINAETLRIEWEDMVVNFASDEAISECSVEVLADISFPVFTRRLESLLDCGAKSESLEWTMKWADRISRYGELAKVRAILCDKVASLNGETGETIGVLKIKRRSVKSGHAKVRLVPTEDSLQVICRHTNAQGLKSVWKSVLHRLRPQYPSGETKTDEPTITGNGFKVSFEPCILVEENVDDDYYYNEALTFLSRRGYSVESGKNINMRLPLDFDASLDSDYSWFYCEVLFDKVIPANMPNNVSLQKSDNGKMYVSVRTTYKEDFRSKAMEISNWLNLGWNLESAS